MPDWFPWVIVVICILFIVLKSMGMMKSKRRKVRTKTRDQKIRQLERELRMLKRN